MDKKYSHIGSPEIKLIEESGELIKECSELIKAICKSERFGPLNSHPNYPDITNIDLIMDEMNDVRMAMDTLKDSLKKIEHGRVQKLNGEC